MNLQLTFASLLILVQALTAQPLLKHAPSKPNTPYDEMNPVITPDGKTLFITIANHPENLGGKRDPGDIWYCSKDDNSGWSEPIHAGSLINDKAFNGVAGFSSDGSEMILLSHYDPSGNVARTQGIAVARRQGSIWSRPENITIPYFQNKSSIVSGHVTPDQRFFVYSAETYGSYGVEDIFVCLRKPDGKWSEPKNLGARINTAFQEISPSLSMDGKTLYFSTNGRKGKGSFDIFSATRLDDTWQNWTEPTNLESVNTEGRDLFYHEYAVQGYSMFTSTNNSDKYGDIRTYKPETPIPVDSTAIAQEPVLHAVPEIKEVKLPEKESADNHSVIIYGKVVNSKTGESIPAKIVFEAQSTFVQGPGTLNVASSGYSVTVPSTTQYVLKIESKGFISSREKLDIQTYEMKDLEMNFKLQPIEVGATVNLKDVLFEQSRTVLLPQSFDELDLVVAFLNDNPTVKIELAGHTDNRGIPSQNAKLSQGRVDKVKEYLISKGIESKRISGKGYGGTKPIASNETEETRKLNRRVEFTIKKN